MSQLNVNSIFGPGSTAVRVESPSVVYAPGHIIQVVWGISKEKYYQPIGDNNDSARGFFGGGTWNANSILRPLDLKVTPKSLNSFIHLEYNVCYEADWNIGFQILRNGHPISIRQGDPSVDGDFNLQTQQVAAVGRYDNNTDTTPSVVTFCGIDRPGTLEPVVYSVGVRCTNSRSVTMVLNGGYSNYQAGSDGLEAGVSVSIAQEIAY